MFRSSISLVVIMVEGTGGISFVFCIIVAVVVSNAVSSWFQNHGVYHLDLERNPLVAFLSGEPPRWGLSDIARHVIGNHDTHHYLLVVPQYTIAVASALLVAAQGLTDVLFSAG